MWDHTVPNIDLAMRRDTLERLPEIPLPQGYTLRFYQPGDEHHLARIERSAEEFQTDADALAGFEKYYGAHRQALPERMLFLLDADGLPVGTATAWTDRPAPLEGEEGRLHWVGIAREHQGKGLSKPLVAAALHRLQALGHQDAYLTTQTPSWVAIRVYLQLGFHPAYGHHEKEQEGWAIVREKLPDMEIPALTK